MEGICRAKYLKISQKKMVRFISVVRGRRLDLVLAYLEMLPHKGAKFLYNAIKSAYANMVYKGSKATLKDAFVKDIKVNQSFSIKRVIPRARGSADIIKRRFSSIYVVVSDEVTKEE
ncbi:MAG: uL22 family ribosomal protein [Brevinematales bacterium]|nr:uL22 family ribosomal protein [Brevinematales bacterium]